MVDARKGESLVAFCPYRAPPTPPSPQTALYDSLCAAGAGSIINRRPNADLDVPPNVRYWG